MKINTDNFKKHVTKTNREYNQTNDGNPQDRISRRLRGCSNLDWWWDGRCSKEWWALLWKTWPVDAKINQRARKKLLFF